MINYDLRKVRCVIFDIDGVLSANTIPMDNEGMPVRTVNIKDGYAIQLAVKCGLKIAIITGAKTESVRARYEGLGVKDVFIGCSQKVATYNIYKEREALADEEIVYVGDDIPDYEIMRLCGCPCCPADACPEIKSISTYVSPVSGGYGVGRDILEQILREQGQWRLNERAFGW
ncbi:MAG: 3-deoxy-D-manno-octulosonate 8-phosphate phosphatase [Oscillospiraceae bacterium]|nr:3-deoxy-D-manno-octulosonate 8-phosphate phosphatase [Oscillospiraceae bacterium]